MSQVKPIQIRSFNRGGISESKILGEPDSLFKMVGTDVHSDVGLLKASRRLANSGGAVIDKLVKVQVSCSNGKQYAFSSGSGKVWEWSGSAWVLVYTVASVTGTSYITGAYEYNNYLYFATQNYLYRIQLDYTALTWSSYVEEVGHLNVDPVVGDSGALGGITNDYDLTTGVDEGAAHKLEFSPSLQTISGVTLNIKTVPATSLTIKLHDSANVEKATVTVNAGSLTTGYNEIYFASPFTYVKGATYHLHAYRTGAGGEIRTVTTDDFSTAYLEVFGEGNPDYHPMAVVSNVLFIGDGRYIHQVENVLTLWALDIPMEYSAKSLEVMDVDLVVGTEVSTLVHKALILRWNTWSESWSIEDPIYERSINAFIPVDNFVYALAGTKGNVYFYNGSKLELFRRIGGEFDPSDAILVNPNAVANLNGIPLIGVSNSSGNPIECGVYGMGTVNPRLYPRIFDLEYVLSCGLTDVQIGSIGVLGNDIFVAWQLGTGGGATYGIDMFDSTDLNSGSFIQTRAIYQERSDRSTYTGLTINYASIQTNSVAVTMANAGDVMTATAHGLQNGEPVKFTGASISAPLVAGTEYFVINKTANTFQVSETLGGAVRTLSADGSGTLEQSNLLRAYYRTNYATDWIEITLIHDTEKKQFVAESFGVDAFCFELKLELRSRGSACPVIDEITLRVD